MKPNVFFDKWVYDNFVGQDDYKYFADENLSDAEREVLEILGD